MSSHSKKKDEILTEFNVDGIINVSFKYVSTEQILAAMHCNETKSGKARYETLSNEKRQLI